MKKDTFIKYLVLNIFCFPLFYIFSYIIPKSKNLILLGSSFGKRFSGNTKYYYLYLIKNKKKNFYWVTSNKKIFSDLKQRKYPVLYFFSIKTFFYILRARHLIIDNAARDITYIVFLNGRFNIIQTWHGLPLKNNSLKTPKSLYGRIFHYLNRKEQQLYKVILACSKNDAKSLMYAMSNENTRIIGYPRNDIFFNKDLNYENYKKRLGLGKYSKVLLYAPTFRDGQKSISPFSKEFLVRFNNYLKENNYILLIKKHPLFANELRIPTLDYIRHISDIVDDIQEVLIDTDVLITDYSGVIFDFCLTNRPIFFYSYDYEAYIKNCRKMDYDYFKEMPGPFANNEEELFNLVKNIDQWFKDKNYKKRYKQFKDKFHKYQDGKSSERLGNLVKNHS